MYTPRTPACYSTRLLAFAALMIGASSMASGLQTMIDDFSDPDANSLGVERQYLTDRMTGGASTLTPTVADGTLSVSGTIAPPRGQLGWASSVLVLNAKGKAVDASAFDGVRLRIRMNRGKLSISANSTRITNFDYHAASIIVKADGEFHEVRVPFASMKRAWSEQTELDTATIASISLVAFALKKSAYDFEIDDVGFY